MTFFSKHKRRQCRVSKWLHFNVERLEPRHLLAADLIAAWSADDLIPALDDESVISKWPDQAGLVTAVANGSPQLVSNRLNGHAAVRLDPLDYFRISADADPIQGLSEFAIATVFSTESNSLVGDKNQWYLNSGIVDASSFGFARDWGIAISSDGTVSAGIGTPAKSLFSADANYNDGIAHVAILSRTRESLSLYIDGIATSRTDVNNEPRDARTIKFGSGGAAFDGTIAEIQFFAGDLLPEAAISLTKTLRAKYVNYPPQVHEDSYRTPEDKTLIVSRTEGLLTNDEDLEQDSFTAILQTLPEHGALTLAPDGSFVYQPQPNFFGTDRFEYLATDGRDSAPAQVTIEVVNQRDPIKAVDDEYVAMRDETLVVTASQSPIVNDMNPDQGNLTAKLSTLPNSGQIDFRTDGSFQYAPQPGFTGVDRFSYRISDRFGSEHEAIIEIRVQSATVLISEIMATNWQSLQDTDQESSDWIEIFNFGQSPLNLAGWHLTDQQDNLRRWTFPPETVIPPEDFLIVFASGKDRRIPGRELHTNFRLSAAGETLAIVMPDGATIATARPLEFPPQLRDVSFGLPQQSRTLIQPNQYHYLSTATPGVANSPTDVSIGPIITAVTHQPERPSLTKDFIISATISDRLSEPITAEAHLRMAYGSTISLPLRDDGMESDIIANDGIYTVNVPADTFHRLWESDSRSIESLPGNMLRYFVTTRDQSGRTSRSPYLTNPDDSTGHPEYYGTIIQQDNVDTALPTLHWFVPDPTWHITRNGNSTRWSPASVYFAGQFYDNLKVKVRGISTTNWPKPKFKFEFNPGDPFRHSNDHPAVDEFNLQSHYREKGATSYMGENLAFGFLNEIGVPAPITQHYQVRQNGQFYSLASFVEQIDESFLERHQLDISGALYKANSPSARSTLAPNPTRSDYQKVTQKQKPFDDLIQFTNGLNNRIQDQDRSSYIFDHVNLPEVINNMAGNTILTNHDRLTKNYYIYRDATTEEWWQFPWDMDQAFALRTDPNFSSVFYGDTQHPQAPGQPVYQNHLLDAILDTPSTRQMYLRRLRTLFDEYLAGDYFETRIKEYDALISGDAARDHARWKSGDPTAGIRRLTDHLRYRHKQLSSDSNLPGSNQAFEIGQLLPAESIVRVFVPTSNEDAIGWRAPRFDDSIAAGWRVGKGGVGYDRATDYEPFLGELYRDEEQTQRVNLLDEIDPDGDGHGVSSTVYARFPFPIDDYKSGDRIELHMRYDDAFVAYLNGTEIARANISGEVDWNSTSRSGNHEANSEFEVFDITALIESGIVPVMQGTNVLAVIGINAQRNSPDLLIQPSMIRRREIGRDFDVDFGVIQTSTGEDFESVQFIELVNQEAFAVDLTDWHLAGGIQYNFRAGTVIPAHGSLFVTSNIPAFRDYQRVTQDRIGLFVQGPYLGSVNTSGLSTQLVDDWGQTVDQYPSVGNHNPLHDSLRISELHYNPAGTSDSTEFIELSHVGSEFSLDLTGVTITDGPSTPYIFASGTTLQPGESRLVVKDRQAFLQAYPNVNQDSIDGEFSGSFANAGETIRIVDENNLPIIDLTYDDSAPWPPLADGGGFTLQLINPQNDLNDGSNWRPSAHLGGTPGRMAAIFGDLDRSGKVNRDDINLLCRVIRNGSDEIRFDLSHDGQLDEADLTVLIEDILKTSFGDANLDGRFDSRDFVSIFQAGEYEDSTSKNSTWSEGDWNCDQDFNSADLMQAFQLGQFSAAVTLASIDGNKIAAALSTESRTSGYESNRVPLPVLRNFNDHSPQNSLNRPFLAPHKALDFVFEKQFSWNDSQFSSSPSSAPRGQDPASIDLDFNDDLSLLERALQ
ncbi:MAG: tandem-95 repeat protein [Planctomycetaceae bacterium]|nr:tandem-95 repeat protein [Planctomycetaceae bacterium]